jgi:hypothetical protein
VRQQEPEVRQQEPEVRQQEPEVRQQEPEVRQQEPEARQPERVEWPREQAVQVASAAERELVEQRELAAERPVV